MKNFKINHSNVYLNIFRYILILFFAFLIGVPMLFILKCSFLMYLLILFLLSWLFFFLTKNLPIVNVKFTFFKDEIVINKENPIYKRVQKINYKDVREVKLINKIDSLILIVVYERGVFKGVYNDLNHLDLIIDIYNEFRCHVKLDSLNNINVSTTDGTQRQRSISIIISVVVFLGVCILFFSNLGKNDTLALIVLSSILLSLIMQIYIYQKNKIGDKSP